MTQYLSDFPEIAKQWHPTKNGDLLPSQVTCNNNKKVWWLCPNTCEYGCLHEYQQQVRCKTRGDGCPYCSSTPTKICVHQSLEFKCPEIAKQWHPTKNGNLLPSQVTCGSNKKVWWLCPNTCEYGCLHEYEKIIQHKTSGCGCPYCSIHPTTICYHQSLEFKYPEIAEQWHPTKNGNLLPSHITCGSGLLVWWLCEIICEYGCLHEYQQRIGDKTRREYGCPYCSPTPTKICVHQSLEFKCPEIAKQWHPTKNSDLLPSQVTYGSEKKVWWLCPNTCEYGCLHEYQQIIRNKTSGQDCPYCSTNSKKYCYHQSFEFKYPEIVKQWHPTKNGDLLPSQVTCSNNYQKVWWLCPNTCEYGCLHEYQQAVYKKTNRNDGCPYCAPNPTKICYHQSLKFNCPEIAKLWHPTKNGNLSPSHVTCKSGQYVWWLCPNTCEYGCLHEYQQQIQSKTNGCGCSYCAPNPTKICYHQSLEFKYPEIAKQWHPTKNGDLLPSQVTCGSDKKPWWLCPNPCKYGCLHEYQQAVSHKTNRNEGCPYCSPCPIKICYHQSLEFNYPEIAKLWHPTKNGDLSPSQVTCGSGQYVWWLCENGHEHQQNVNDKRSGHGCNKCFTNYSKIQIIWLSFIATHYNLRIIHAENEGEFSIPNTKYKADGYCSEINTIYEFHGDFWHGNPRIYDLNEMNDVTGITFGELYQKTIDKEQTIKNLGYNLAVMWENDWYKINNSFAIFQQHFKKTRNNL